MRHTLASVRTVIFYTAFLLGTVPMVIIAFVLMPFSTQAMSVLARVWGRYHHGCARVFLGIRTQIVGAFRNEPIFYAFKHESLFETFELLRLFDRPVVIAKQELSAIPLWSTIAKRHGMIFVDRSGGATALRAMMKEVRGYIAEGRPIIIFPEGQSVPPGEYPPLQSGFAALYKLLGLPVIPVALNSGTVTPRHSFTNYSGEICYQIGEEIAAGLPRAEIEERVHTAINALNSPERKAP